MVDPKIDAPNKDAPETLALSTKLEEQFVAPLTAIRGALEILRDYPDQSAEIRARFIETALKQCFQIERGVRDLATAVYAAGRAGEGVAPQSEAIDARFADRIRRFDDLGVIDIDFSDYTFQSAAMVNAFYDAIDRVATQTDQRWWFIVNHRDSHVWPEAWVAFAHRGKKVLASYALGAARYVDRPPSAGAPPGEDVLPSREAAFAKIEAMKAARR